MATVDKRKYRNPVADVQDMIANMANEYAGISPGTNYDVSTIDKNVYAMPRGMALPPDVEIIKGGSKWMPTITREREFFPGPGQSYPADITPFSRKSMGEQNSFIKYMEAFTKPLAASYAHIAGAQAAAAPHAMYNQLMKSVFEQIKKEKEDAAKAEGEEAPTPARPPAAVSPEGTTTTRPTIPAVPGISTVVPDYLNPNKTNPWLQYEPYAPKKEKKRKKVFGE